VAVFLAGAALAFCSICSANGFSEIAGADAKGCVQQVQQIVVGRIGVQRDIHLWSGFVLQGFVGEPLKIVMRQCSARFENDDGVIERPKLHGFQTEKQCLDRGCANRRSSSA